MTYTRGEPQRNDQGLVSQPKLLANNDGVDDIFGIDHYMFSSTVNDRGKHKAVRFKDQTSAGDPVTESDEFALYAKEDSDSDLELFARRPSNGTVYQITKGNTLFTDLVPAAAANFDGTGALVSGFNISSVVRDLLGRFTINFTTPLPNNNYEWSIQGMGTNLLITGVRSNANYSNSVDQSFIRVEFKTTAGAFVDPVRGSVIIFRRIS